MCGCDDCCGARDHLKYGCICFAVVAAVVTFAVLLAAYSFVRQTSITVDEASLTRFEMVTSPATGLAYNLSLKLDVRNRNWAMGMKNTKPLEAACKFDGQMFDRVKITDEGDKHPAGKTVVHHLDVSSEGRVVSLGNAGEATYKEQSKKGVFEVEVAITGEVRYTARYTKCKLEATCPLKLQIAPEGTAAVVFEKVKCKLAQGREELLEMIRLVWELVRWVLVVDRGENYNGPQVSGA